MSTIRISILFKPNVVASLSDFTNIHVLEYINNNIRHKNINTVGYVTNIIDYQIIDYGRITYDGQIEFIVDVIIERYMIRPKETIITTIKEVNKERTGYLTSSIIPVYIDNSTTNRKLSIGETVNVEIMSVKFNRDKFIAIGNLVY